MLAALPYFRIPPLTLGPLELHAFGFLVGIAIIVGTALMDRRADRLGLSRRVTTSFAMWAIVPGFIGAHLVSVIFYSWDRVVEDPLLLLKFWDGISSFGGFLGGAAGVIYYLLRNRIPFWPYTDAFAYAFTFAWIFGRMGCTVAFDHPGVESDFWGAMEYVRANQHDTLAEVSRHNLGFYELCWTLVMASVFYFSRDKARPSGWYLATWLVMYTPVRFCFDFLRIRDTTYLGLTVAQYLAVALFFLSIWMLLFRLRTGEPVVPNGEEHVFKDGRRAFDVPAPHERVTALGAPAPAKVRPKRARR